MCVLGNICKNLSGFAKLSSAISTRRNPLNSLLELDFQGIVLNKNLDFKNLEFVSVCASSHSKKLKEKRKHQ